MTLTLTERRSLYGDGHMCLDENGHCTADEPCYVCLEAREIKQRCFDLCSDDCFSGEDCSCTTHHEVTA